MHEASRVKRYVQALCVKRPPTQSMVLYGADAAADFAWHHFKKS
jgi:hypothetical protein